MHVNAGSLDAEIRLTAEAAVDLANRLLDPDVPPSERAVVARQVLIDHDFVRAAAADDRELAEFADRCIPVARLVDALPEADLADAVARINAALEGSAIAPSLSAHDGFALHIHWTSATTPFAHQVTVDLLMGLAQTLCDHGTDRFGRCAADGCARVFYDATKNRSRRFCDDPRCASRTHTAAHRARAARDT